ncbi:uncharacterized protein LOC116301108 [Actinia tenebrosa]|uniref:Uncharacterized protein LOC116301108 n=1 Tax=Actinia tenebrosa TaxID=6105 RepID=A0A6P8IGM8_ACTTE|nr:uncharacterized protein LOC116301108 [Actinia tenebrosa]
MVASYPEALRWRVIYLSYGEGLRVSEISLILKVSETFVKKIIRIYNGTHSVNDNSHRGGRPRMLDAHDILLVKSIIDQYPEAYEDEISEWLRHVTGKHISVPSISRHLRQIGFSRRKLNVIARQRDERNRAEYRHRVSAFIRNQLLFVDESAKDSRTFQRRYARDLVGTGRISIKGNFTRGSRYSVLAAISVDGVIASHVIDGAYDREQYEFAFLQFILPHIGRFSRQEANSVIIMDNCIIHYSDVVTNAVRNKGGIIMFLPPYSPDFNPIEDCFNFCKKWLQRNQEVCYGYPKRCFEIALNQVTQAQSIGFFEDCGYL